MTDSALDRKTKQELIAEIEALRQKVAGLEATASRGLESVSKNLRDERNLLRMVIDILPDNIFVKDVEGHFLLNNSVSMNILGVERQEDLLGKTDFDILPPHHAEESREDELEVIESGQPVLQQEVFVPENTDKWRWLVYSTIPLRNEQGEIIGIVGMNHDITQRKRVEEELEHHRQNLEELVEQRTAELRKANEQLIALSQVKDEFVSNVSHELRTPITSLTIRQHLLRKDPQRMEYHLDVMQRETERLRHTIEDLLQLSRLDQKQTPLKLLPLDINTVIKRYVSDRRPIAETKNLSMALLEASDLPGVPADEGLLEQTLGILLNNAMNYTPSGGSITVKTMCQESWVGFSVADSGPGIPPEDQPRLFERFFRGKTGRASGATGTGLGLAIAKEIVDRHGGKIEVESSGIAGEGARFAIWLPEAV